MKLVEIWWRDSKGVTSEWEFKEDIKPMEPATVYSVGYMLDDNDLFKTIVQSKTETQVMGRLTIPAGCIKEITVLKE